MAYIPIGHQSGDNLNLEIVLEKLRPILAGDNYPKVFQNAKFDIDIFYHQGITVKGLVFDTMVASKELPLKV